jgi:hypothetical protein
MCDVLLPPDVNPTAVKYIYHIKSDKNTLHEDLHIFILLTPGVNTTAVIYIYIYIYISYCCARQVLSGVGFWVRLLKLYC